MKIEHSTVTKLILTDLDRLDPVTVIAEDLAPRQGKITITCHGKSWTAYWGGMGTENISEFFRGCDNHYLMGYLAPNVDSEIYDLEAFQKLAKKKNVDCWRDDPWNDYEIMTELFGNDMSDWADRIPKEANYEYKYICRIIDAVKSALEIEAASMAA